MTVEKIELIQWTTAKENINILTDKLKIWESTEFLKAK